MSNDHTPIDTTTPVNKPKRGHTPLITIVDEASFVESKPVPTPDTEAADTDTASVCDTGLLTAANLSQYNVTITNTESHLIGKITASNLSFPPTAQTLDVQYRDILADVMINGMQQSNRTGIPSKWLPSATIKADLRVGFPISGLRKIYPMAAIGEMMGFLRGYTNSKHFEELGCKYWGANANKPTAGSDTSPWLSSRHRIGPDDLGEIYGDLWRNWQGDDGVVIDQVADLVYGIATAPDSRRLMVTGWKPESIKQVRGALPPCHVSWHVLVDTEKRELHLTWYQRSVDLVLGLPSNIVGYAFLLKLLAHITGYKAATLTGHLDCVHIYENHYDAANLMRVRTIPRVTPTLDIATNVGKPDPETGEPALWFLKTVSPNDIHISGYHPNDAIPGLIMAV